MFIWKLLHNAIPVGENLKSRQVNPDVKCPLYNSEETAIHLFFHCSFAQEVWKQAPTLHTIEPSSIRTIQQGLAISKSMLCLPPTGVESNLLGHWILWTIWNQRIKKIFGEHTLNATETISKSISMARDWFNAQPQKDLPVSLRVASSLPRYGPDSVICNSDAAWLESRKIAGSGWCIKDQSGNLLSHGTAISHQAGSPLIAEAQALLHAMEHALSHGFCNIVFASDSLLLVKATQSGISPKEIHGILQDILKVSSSFSSVSFLSIPRDANFQADHLAKQALYQL